MKNKITVVQEIYHVPVDHRGKPMEPVKTTIQTIGRKYFTIKSDRNGKYNIDDLKEVCEIGHKSRCFLSLQEIEEEKEIKSLFCKIGGHFEYLSQNNLSLDQLRRIYLIINETPNK